MFTSLQNIDFIQLLAINGQGSAEVMASDKLANISEPFWLHMDYSVPSSRQWLATQPDLPKIVREVLLQENTRPRCLVIDDGILACFRGINLNPGADPEDMVSVRLYIRPGFIISTGKRPLLSLKDTAAALLEGRGARSTDAIFTELLERLAHRMDVTVDDFAEHADDLEEKVSAHTTASLKTPLADLRRGLIRMKRYFSPQRDALQQLYDIELSWLGASFAHRIKEVLDKQHRHLEDLTAMQERMTVCQEELQSHISDKMNERMYMLSIVTAVFLPLGFLTGLLGVNVGGIPGAENPLAFWLFFGLLLTLVIGQLWYFKHRNWL